MSNHPKGPPYAPQVAALGGIPTVNVDVPICCVFLVLFLGGAISNMTIFQINKRHGHKFIMSALTFGFCMARTLTMILRIVWAVYPTDVQIAIAASIFVSAGVLLLFVINLIFAQRVLRAAHPNFGWHKSLSTCFKILYALVVAMLVMVITATIQSYYTLRPDIKRIDRDLQLTAVTYLMVVSFLPIPMVVLGLIVPRKTRVEKFGQGRWRTKIAILLTSAVLLCLGASFRAGTAYKNPRPRNSPAWYQAKWCFYFFNFVIEIIVVYLYLFLRVDRRFHIPDGSKGPGDYSGNQMESAEKNIPPTNRPSTGSASRILTEEEVFDDQSPVDQTKKQDFDVV